MVLTYIKGDKVDQWVKRIAKWWDTLDPLVHNVHYTWTLFLRVFRTQYLDHVKQQQAGIKLETYRFCFPLVDKYVAEFKDLATLVKAQQLVNALKRTTAPMGRFGLPPQFRSQNRPPPPPSGPAPHFPQYNSMNAPRWMNNILVPIDLSRGRAPFNHREGQQSGQGQWRGT